MATTLSPGEEAQLAQTIEMFEVITQSQPNDYQSLEILKEAYSKLGREEDVRSASKRIAQAYVLMGQFSSAILEYETILQRYPDDPDVQTALKDIEARASNIAIQPALSETAHITKQVASGKSAKKSAAGEIEDGRKMFTKLFVDSKIITAGDFDLCWHTSDLSAPPNGVAEPFIQVLADKNILPLDKSLRLLVERAHIGFMPLDKYDVDIDLIRSFPADVCRRWCILPFDRMSKSIMVATANPFNQQAVRELAETTPSRLLWYLAPPQEIVKNLNKVFR
ncbi:MAG TPA: hypothetical protein PKA41_02490 [Verrucomicrobiota bacterium]|nr:hypothetical protein [Verrucomicrobiota bacterium]